MVAHIWPADHGAAAKVSDAGSQAVGYAAGLTTWLLVGGVFVAAKFGVDEMPPWTMCFWRLLIATLILLPLVWADRAAILAFLRKRGLEALVVGAIGLGLTQGLIYNSLAFTSAINCGIIFSISPIMTLVLAGIFLREPMGRWQFVGSAVAFAGIVIIAVQGSLAILLGLRLGIGDLLVFVGAITFAGYTVLLKRAKFDLGRMPLLVVLLIGGVIATFPGSMIEVWYGMHSRLAYKGYIALAYAAIPGGALMYLLYNWSVEILGASRAGALLYSQMIFTAFLAWLILGETIAWYHVVGAVLIIIGVVLIELLKAKTAKVAVAKE
jgi:drug/metabolite transporter (DMT)-like permease